MDGNPDNPKGEDGLAGNDPSLGDVHDVTEPELGELFPGSSDLESHPLEDTELYEPEAAYFDEPGFSSSQANVFDESQRSVSPELLDSATGNIHSSSLLSRHLHSTSPVQNLQAVDPSAILSPEHAGGSCHPLPLLQPTKRGPGRPRKDGQSPIPRKGSGRGRVFGTGRGSRCFPGERTSRSRGTGRRGRPSSVHSLGYRRALQSQAAHLQLSSERLGQSTSLLPSLLSQRMDTVGISEELKQESPSASGDVEPSQAIQSSVPSETVEQGPVHVCAFCGCGEKSLLGQGELHKYDPTIGFNPFKRVLQKLRKGVEYDEKGQEKNLKPLTWRRRRGPPKDTRERSRSPRQSSMEDESISQTSDELSQVGHSEDVEVGSVFEPSGHVWAHHCCAVWSEHVTSDPEGKLQFVDRAVFSGLSQKCSYCRRYGATITCRGPKCQKRFHFPCASAGGCFQEMKSRSLLCTDHLDQAENLGGTESLCVQCATTGNVSEQLFCTTCGHHYHGNCLCPPVEVKPTVRAGWQCPNCKICQTCRHPGDDCKMLVCDLCDKGYHTFCLKPVMTTIPKNGWKCKNCRICSDCGARTPGNGPSSRWHHNYSVCDSCYQQRNKGLCCPLCSKAYRHFDNKQMVQCNSCKKYVHSDCDLTIDNALLTKLKDTGQTDYICTVCRDQDDTDIDSFPLPPSLVTEDSMEGFPPKNPDYSLKDDPYLNEASLTAASSQESLYYEDSSSSMDIDMGVAEKPTPLTSTSGLASYMAAKAEILESQRGRNSVGRHKVGAGRPRTRPTVPEKKNRRPLGMSESRRRGPKGKVKTGQLSSLSQGSSRLETDSSKGDDSGDDHPSTIVLTSSKDKYVLDQDICKSCGAFGTGDEGRLIACTQCGQCYHPHCANVKITKVILQKGWRCLDCTVCEGCGSPKDEGRLLLCDDCDISYHTYCLVPPLEHVPKGTWKCKWCVRCNNCGSTSPGFGCMWQNNYTQCGACYSKLVCPVCRSRYREEELIIQCVQCDRWLHSFCDGIKCEDDAERAADYGYQCLFCRPKTGHPGPLPPPPPPPPPPEEKEIRPLTPPIPLPKEPEVPKQFLMDGVYLSASGIQQIQSLTVSLPKKTRQRRMVKKLDKPMDPHSKHPHVARLLAMSSVEGDESLEKDQDDKQAGMDELEPPMSVAAPGVEGAESEEQGKRRRQRKHTGLGVGGFIVRQRTRTWKRQSSATEITPEDGAVVPKEGLEGAGFTPDGTPLAANEKTKKRRKPRTKSQLEENFPAYLQEAFFGRPLLDVCKDNKESLQLESDAEKEKSDALSQSDMLLKDGDPSKAQKEEPLVASGVDDQPEDIQNLYDSDLKDILPPDLHDLPHDEDILNMLGTDSGLPMETESVESTGDSAVVPRKDLSENLDSMLNPNLEDKNLDVDSMFSDVVPALTQIDSKVVEDVFKVVLESTPDQPSTSGTQFPIPPLSQPPIPGHPLQHLPPRPSPGMGSNQQQLPLPGASHIMSGPSQMPTPLQMPPEPPTMALPPLHSPSEQDQPLPPPQGSMGPYGMPQYTPGPQQVSPGFSAAPNPAWALGADEEHPEPTSRRNILKWENDEALGLNATISAVLYVNTNYPNLRKDYPDWSERSKQIAKMWKKLTPDEKAPFLTQARKNRTSSRVQKAQKQVTDEMRRRQQEARQRYDSSSMPPPPAPPPLPSPGARGPGMGDPFMVPPGQLSPQALDNRPLPGMLSPRHPGMQSPGKPMDGQHMVGGQSPQLSPHGPVPRPPWVGDDGFHKSQTVPGMEGFAPPTSRVGETMMGQRPGIESVSPGAGIHHSVEPASRSLQPDPYAFQPSTPLSADQFPEGSRPLSHPQGTQPYDLYSQPPNTPRPAEEDPFLKIPSTSASPTRPFDPFGRPPGHPVTLESFKAPTTPRLPGPGEHSPSLGTPRSAALEHFQYRPRLPHPLSPGGPGSIPRPPDAIRQRQPVPDPYAFAPGTPRPSSTPEEMFLHPRTSQALSHGMRQQLIQQLSPGIRHPSPEQLSHQQSQQPATSQPTDPYAQQPMTPHPAMPQSPQSPQSTPGPLRHPEQPFQQRQPHQQLARSLSLPDPFTPQPGTGGMHTDGNMSRSVSQLSPVGGIPRGPRPPFMQEKPVHPESFMLQQLYNRRHSHLQAAGSWLPSSSISHTVLGPGGEILEGVERGIQGPQLRGILAQQILKARLKKQQEESEKIKGPHWPPQEGLSPGSSQGIPPGFVEADIRPPAGFTEQVGPHPERWAALRQRMIRPPNPSQFPSEAEAALASRAHLEMPVGYPGPIRQPRPPAPGRLQHPPFPHGGDPSQMPGQFPPTSLPGQTPESHAHLQQMLQERQAAQTSMASAHHLIRPPVSQAVSTASTLHTSEGLPAIALRHPAPPGSQASHIPGQDPKHGLQGTAQMLPRFARQTSQPPSQGSDEDPFKENPLTSARDPMISENNLKPSSGEGLDEAGLSSQSDTEQLHLSDIDLKVPKPSMSSEDEKPEDDDLLSADGTFDILKFADPELGSDDDKFLDEQLDFIAGSSKPEETKSEQVPKTEGSSLSEPKKEGFVEDKPADAQVGRDASDDKSHEKTVPAKDFQAKFLEFNQQRQQQLAADAARLAKDGKKDDKKGAGPKETKHGVPGVSHIAALLQGSESVVSRMEKSEIEKRLQAGVKAAEDGKPQTDPLGLGHRPGLGPAMSPLQGPHHGQLTPAHMSPSGSIGVPGTPGLPSPKFMPSPRSGQPSPRTPNMQSPFSQMASGSVHSPHSQPLTPGAPQLSPSVQSPFSPPVSAQSPFGGVTANPQPQGQQRPVMNQPGFGLNTPQGMLAHSPQGQQFPMHHSPRATITPTNQYMQGTYGQQLNAVPPRGGTLTPTPNSILYGQSITAQHGIRLPGHRMPFPQNLVQGEEGLGAPQDGSHMGLPGHPTTTVGQGEATAAEMTKLLAHTLPPASTAHAPERVMVSERPGMPPQTSHPNIQHQLSQGHPAMGPRGLPPGFMNPAQPRMPHPGMRLGGPRMMGFPGPSGAGMIRPGQMPPPQPKEQSTLLDELLEQEKQEQKRQAEQQAMVHRREMGGKPEAMIPPGLRPGLHHKLGPRLEHPRMPGPEGPWSATPPNPHQGEMAGNPPFPGYGPRGQLSPRTPSPFQPSTLGMQPPRMSPPPMTFPPPQPPVPSPSGEPGPEYEHKKLQYEDWLTKQTQFLDMQIKVLDQQIAKQKRSKKSIQARQRQARKNGNELNPNDTAELERITTELSGLSKQQDGQRKQQRQHQMVVQDYRNKQKDQIGRSWMLSPGVQQGMMSPQPSQSSPVSSASSTATPQSPVSTQSNTPPQPLGGKSAASGSSVRLTRTDRQEYEAYMQNRLRMLSQQQSSGAIPMSGPQIRMPTPAGQVPAGQMPTEAMGQQAGATPQSTPGAHMPPAAAQNVSGQTGPRHTMVLGDNNPFSEDFQQREQLERFREKNRSQIHEGPKSSPAPATAATGDVPEAAGAQPEGIHPPSSQSLPQMQFFRDRGMSFEQGPRFPRAPGLFVGEGAPRPFEGPRPPAYPGPPGPPGTPGLYPPMPGPEQSRHPFPQGMSFPPGFGIPPTANLPPEMVPQAEKEKKKTRRKTKKKTPESENAQSQPLPPSIPTQATVLGPNVVTTGAVPVTTSAATVVSSPATPQPPPAQPKIPEFPIKPQSETERRILEILSNTAALAQKEGDEQTPGGKVVRGKSSAVQMSAVPQTASSTSTSSGSGLEAQSWPIPQSGTTPQSSLTQPPTTPTPPVSSSPSTINTPTSNISDLQQDPANPIAQVMPDSSPLDQIASSEKNRLLEGNFPAVSTVETEKSVTSSNASIPLLETQVSQSSASAQTASYESPPHLQPQTSVASQALTGVASQSQESSSPSEIAAVESGTAAVENKEGNIDETDGGGNVTGEEQRTEPSQNFVCDDGIHCGTDDEQEGGKSKASSDTVEMSIKNENEDDQKGATTKTVCDDGIHCGTDDEDCTTAVPAKTKGVCDDGIHCGTDDEDCTTAGPAKTKGVCDDGIHCGTDDEDDITTAGSVKTKRVCDDGIHCGTDDEDDMTTAGSAKTKGVCDDGIHCGTDDEDDLTTASSAKTKGVCDDGIHCGTDDENDMKTAGSVKTKRVCDDGIHCGTDDEDDMTTAGSAKTKGVCDDGIHCGTDDENDMTTAGSVKAKGVCDDGIHCGTDDEDDMTTVGSTKSKGVCDDGIHCGTDDEDSTTVGPVKSKKVCDDGIHCGTDDEDESNRGKNSSESQTKTVCDDGIHCGTDDEDDVGKAPEPPRKTGCEDGEHCGTDDEEEKLPAGQNVESHDSEMVGQESSQAENVESAIIGVPSEEGEKSAQSVSEDTAEGTGVQANSSDPKLPTEQLPLAASHISETFVSSSSLSGTSASSPQVSDSVILPETQIPSSSAHQLSETFAEIAVPSMSAASSSIHTSGTLTLTSHPASLPQSTASSGASNEAPALSQARQLPPPGHPFFKQLPPSMSPQMMHEQMMRASRLWQGQTPVSDAKSVLESPTQMSATKLVSQSHQASLPPFSSSGIDPKEQIYQVSTATSISETMKVSETSEQNIPRSQANRALVSQLMQSTFSQGAVSLPGNVTLSSVAPSTVSSPITGQSSASPSTTFAPHSPQTRPSLGPVTSMSDPGMRMPGGFAVQQQMARMQQAQFHPGMMPQRFPPNTQGMQRLRHPPSPQGIPSSPAAVGIPPHSSSQAVPHSVAQLSPRSQLQGATPHSAPHGMPGMAPDAASQGIPTQVHHPSIPQGFPHRGVAPGMPPGSIAQGMHPQFAQRGLSPQTILQRMAQVGHQRLPPHMLQRMPPRMHGQRMLPHNMPPGVPHMPPGMPLHTVLQGIPQSSAQGMPPHSAHQQVAHPGGIPPQPGMSPHPHPRMPIHSGQGIPAHSQDHGMPPNSQSPSMSPGSMGPRMPQHGMQPIIAQQGLPSPSAPHGMAPHSSPGYLPHSAPGTPPNLSPHGTPVSTGLTSPHSSVHAGSPHSMPQQLPSPGFPHSVPSSQPGARTIPQLSALTLPLSHAATNPALSSIPLSHEPVGPAVTPPISQATTPLSNSTASPTGSLSALATPSPVDSVRVKQEPTEETSESVLGRDTGDLPLDSEAALRASQNALLKQLLATHGVKRPSSSTSQGEGDDVPQLTPEQQQQLEMIDKMPIFRETEISAEEWESKTPEEREKILEMRRQEYERKRKEYEELRKAKRKAGGTEGTVEPGKVKRRKKTESKDGVPKKRNRKPKGKDTELESKTESFLQELRSLPPINLQEPSIAINNNIVPVLAANTQIADNLLKGTYGKAYIEGVPDFYGSLQHPNFPLGVRPPGGDIAARRRFLSDGQHIPFSDEQRYQLLSAACVSSQALGQGIQHRMPHLPGGMRPVLPTLPPQPRIEPHLESTTRDTPDTVISSSSPEVGFGDQDPELPALRPIDPAVMDDNDRGNSPAVPLLHPIPVKAEAIKEEVTVFNGDSTKIPENEDISVAQKKEQKIESILDKDALTSKMPALTSSLARPFMDPSLEQQVSVTLTLSATAAEDIGGVISAIADLLKIAVPPQYEMTRSPSPEAFKTAVTHKEEAVNIQSLMKAKPKFCRHCDVVVLSSGIRKKKYELPFLAKEEQGSPFVQEGDQDEEVTFCSMNCYMQFTITHQPPPPGEAEGGNLVEHKSGSTPCTSPRHIPVTSALSISTTPPVTPQSSKDQPATPTTPLSSSTVSKSPMASPALPSPPVRIKEEKPSRKHRRSSSTASDIQLPQMQPTKPLVKKWKDIRWQRWDAKMYDSLGVCESTPSKELDMIWAKWDMVIHIDVTIEDTRKCTLCMEQGDGKTDEASRLLNMDVDKWVHLNCALWSYDVYETLNGALMNVDIAFKRGTNIECVVCGKLGATLSCFKVRCTHTYHLPCAKRVQCVFFQDKTLMCPLHAPKGPVENELESLVVFRRVYINRDEDKQVASMIHQDEGQHILRVGSLVLHSIGQLLPHQIQTGKFHTKDYIYPVGFRTSRFYWSMRKLFKRCRYVCSISDNDGKPEFAVKVMEDGFDEVIFKENTAKDAWMHILSPLEQIRRGADLVKMFPSFTTAEELFGLTEPNVLKVLESLPGTDLLGNYSFRYGRSPLIEMPLAINPTGCARTEPKLRTHFKRRPHTLQSSNSRSLPTTVTGVTGDVNSPYMKQFVHSKSQQYRRLKTEWKANVFLARSGIQGLGLFAARDLEKHTMVIEYIGDLIRNEVANRRETVYEEQNRGVYMFRIDCDIVIDATMAGGPARYINHSCAPNCVAEVVPFEKESKIIIITSRRIAKGEELTYDYKFDFEDDQHKIPCNCGAVGCRKWMN